MVPWRWPWDELLLPQQHVSTAAKLDIKVSLQCSPHQSAPGWVSGKGGLSSWDPGTCPAQ